jgi:ketosteroid isomerase-like protein
VFVPSASSHPADTAEDQRAIEVEIQRFAGAYNSGDLAGVMRCYTDDLVKARHGACAPCTTNQGSVT